MKLAAKRQAQETDSVLSPELSPFCVKYTGSIRRSSSRRRRSHRTLSEETAEEAAEQKMEPLEEVMVCNFKERAVELLMVETTEANAFFHISVASPVPPAGPPSAGHAILSPAQHQTRKPEQHLQLLPRSQQLRGRLRGRRVQRSRRRLQESHQFDSDAMEEENGQREKPLLPNLHPQPQCQRSTEHLPRPQWSHDYGSAHPYVHASSQHGESQGRHSE